MIVLYAIRFDGHATRVVFQGDDALAEARALAFIKARAATHNVMEAAEYDQEGADPALDWERFPALYAALHPTCHHGMDAHLCMDPIGPHHFGTREWEMAQGDW